MTPSQSQANRAFQEKEWSVDLSELPGFLKQLPPLSTSFGVLEAES